MDKLVGAGLFIAALAAGALYLGAGEAPRVHSATSSTEKRVTMAMYRELRDGMSYWGATEVLGREGVETSRNRLDGIPGVMAPIVTIGYSWQNRDGSNIMAMFQNDRLVLRAQAGLR